MYIAYDTKNGVKYAKVCSGKRVGGKVVTSQKSLGRVVDEAKGILSITVNADIVMLCAVSGLNLNIMGRITCLYIIFQN